MATQCGDILSKEVQWELSEANEEAQRMAENATSDRLREEYAKEMPAIEAAIEEKQAVINERIDQVARYIDADMQPVRVEDIMLIHDSPSGICAEPDSAQKEAFMNRVSSADPNTVIVPLGKEREIPVFFIQNFRGIQEFQLEIEGKIAPILIEVHTPILPTIENLQELLKGNNPVTPWGEPIEFHHKGQKPEGPLMVLWQGYHKLMPAEKGEKAMPKPARYLYEKVQKEAICKAIAELYLGNWTQAFKQAKK